MPQWNPSWVSLISACTALIATVVGPYVTIKSARLQAYASVLPNSRARWIDALRDLVSVAVSQLTAYLILRSSVPDHDRPAIARDLALLARVEQNSQTISKIRLMLNPAEPDGQELVRVLQAALAGLRSRESQEKVEADVQDDIEQAVRLCQQILKQEWVRVKQGT